MTSVRNAVWAAEPLPDGARAAWDELTGIEGIGAVLAEALAASFTQPAERGAIDRLLAHLTVEPAAPIAAADSAIAGLTLVFTGTLERMTRAEAKVRAEAMGAKVAGSVSARTDLLVAGPGAGSKAKKAAELGAARIQPVQTDHTNAERIRQDRLQAHAVEAAEQCGGTFVPAIADLAPLPRLLDGWDASRRILWADEALAGGGDGKGAQGNVSPAGCLTALGPDGCTAHGRLILSTDSRAIEP